MPHRIAGFTGGLVWLAGAASFLMARAMTWAQVAAADPSSMLDAAGAGGIAVTSAGALISFSQTARYLIPLILDGLKSAREERERIRQADQAKLAHDERLKAMEAEAREAKAKVVALKAESDASRERRHDDALDTNRTLLAVLAQVRDNTAAVNLILPAVDRVTRRLGERVVLPGPVEPIVDDLPDPVIRIVPTARESAHSSDEIPTLGGAPCP